MVSLFTLLFAITSFLVAKSFQRLSPGVSLGIGLATGLTTLTLPITILLPFVLLPAWLLLHPRAAKRVANWAIVCVVSMLVIAPWTIRNHRVSGLFIPVSAGGGYAVLFGDLFAERFDGFSPYSTLYPSEGALQKLENERISALLAADVENTRFTHVDIDPQTAQRLNKYALRSMIDQPLRFARKLAIQTITFWYLANNQTKTLGVLLIQMIFVVPWLFIGLFFCYRNRNVRVVPLLIMILYLNLIYAATIANMRHGMPAMPLAMVIGAYGICGVISRVRSRQGPNSSPRCEVPTR
jgi:4-amino-4-deoxy-L-arabinose transferase-like glycosyltransferase